MNYDQSMKDPRRILGKFRRPQRGSRKLYVEEGKTVKWPTEKGQTMIQI
jgi:hypothetical protein